MSRLLRNPWFLRAAVGCVLALGLTSAGAQWKNPRLVPPQPTPATEAGNWDGTWLYKNRDFRMVMWIRTQDGRPQLRFRFLRMGNLEGFETDWNSRVDYDFRAAKAKFSLDIRHADENVVKANWYWELLSTSFSREETAKLTLYRIGNGRQALAWFENKERNEVRRGTPRQLQFPDAWAFFKVSKRLVTWEEMPF